MNESHPRAQIGWIIPWTLVIIGAVDVSLRILPRRMLAPLGVNQEILMTPDYSRWRGIFEPNLSIREYGVCGDLSRLGNLPSFCVPAEREFRTDGWSHLNDPSASAPGAASIVLVGDSFSTYSESGMDNDLARLVARKTGRVVYDAGRDNSGALSSAALMDLLDRLQLRSGTVIYQYSEAYFAPPPDEPPDLDENRRHYAGLLPADKWQILRRWKYQFLLQDGLQAGARKLLKRVQDDVVLPNPYRDSVFSSQLYDGRKTLFYGLERKVSLAQREAAIPSRAEQWRDLAAKLRGRNVELIVLLVPNKFTVYGPLFASPSAEGRDRANILRSLGARTQAAGVPVVNLTDPFLEAAALALKNGALLYPPDDTHWGLRAREMAAERVAQFLHDEVPPLSKSFRQVSTPPTL